MSNETANDAEHTKAEEETKEERLESNEAWASFYLFMFVVTCGISTVLGVAVTTSTHLVGWYIFLFLLTICMAGLAAAVALSSILDFLKVLHSSEE